MDVYEQLFEGVAMAGVVSDLEKDLRSVVVNAVATVEGARALLADGLALPPASLDRMLSRESWELNLAIEAADVLGIHVHVAAS